MKISTMLTMALTCAAITAAPQATAQTEYPSKQPITLIVPFAPGGGADLTARLVSEPLAKELGQSIVIENKPGGGGTVGARIVATSEPDGYTLLYTTPGPQLTNPFLMESLPYDPVNDLAPISTIAVVPSVLVVNKTVPVDSFPELIELAKKKPGKIRFASAGIGASSHLSGELLKVMADVEIEHVPYRGTGPAMQDVVGGRVEMAIDSLTVYQPFIDSGAVKALAVTTAERLEALPDVPAVAEFLPGFESSPVNYLSAPGGTPEPIQAKLNAALNKVLADPAVQKRMKDAGLLPGGNSIEEMRQLVASEQEKWKKVIEASGAKAGG
ncbi:Bug family tripartite tricarboxylate transporter substrate binding protein [Yanghanlia caeni]|uniref:Tripartite tricarboxylate transporter substrate binding protein n=1 Tax=Yanghanlia caeni TaxID=3064283 RepID=A0ABU1D9T0_9BURK|nr:tripartite tricarboxylate transporter substrate binding protein [Alcaligenaceae bacterium LG-2]